MDTFFHEKDQPCGVQGRFFPEKKHNPRTAEETGCFFHLLFFHWCVSICILMRRYYKKGGFSSLGTKNPTSLAKPCSVGKRIFLAVAVLVV